MKYLSSMKRKRKSHAHDVSVSPSNNKKVKLPSPAQTKLNGTANHPVICLYYPHVFTLRAYLLQCHPRNSKDRRKDLERQKPRKIGESTSDHRKHVTELLDNVLVGCWEVSRPIDVEIETNQILEELTQAMSSLAGTWTPVKAKRLAWSEVSGHFLRGSSCLSDCD